jgi:hypothetical protein
VVAFVISVLVYARRQSRYAFQQAKNSFEREVDRDLPKNSDKRRVQQFLSAREYGYGELDSRNIMIDPDAWYHDGRSTIQGYSPYIAAYRPICRIFVEFKFDDSDKLIVYRDHLSCKEVLF